MHPYPPCSNTLPEGLHLVLLTRVDPAIELAEAASPRPADRGPRGRPPLHDRRDQHAASPTITISSRRRSLRPSSRGRRRAGPPASASHSRPLDTVPVRRPGGPPCSTSPIAQDFLAAEVLDAQPPEVRSHLLATSILDRFCAPLCDAISPSTAEESGWPQRPRFSDLARTCRPVRRARWTIGTNGSGTTTSSSQCSSANSLRPTAKNTSPSFIVAHVAGSPAEGPPRAGVPARPARRGRQAQSYRLRRFTARSCWTRNGGRSSIAGSARSLATWLRATPSYSAWRHG